MSFVETALAFKSKLRAASPCGYYEGPEHECFRVCTSRPMGPTNPAFSRNSKPPPLGGGVFTGERYKPNHRSEAPLRIERPIPMTDNEIATNFHKLPEVPMNTHDEHLLWHALHRLEVTYWYDVDFNEGRTAHEFFTPDGVKMVGHNRFEGREEIRGFYEWRARQNIATAARQLGIIG